jgi:hypothetical protein
MEKRMGSLRLNAVITVALSCLEMPAVVQGQGAEVFGIAGGAAPTNTGYDLPYKKGTHLSFFLEVPRTIGRLGVRAEIFVGSFSRDTRNGAVSRRTSVPGASLNAVLPIRDTSATIQPYLLIGGGSYRTELGGGTRELHFGIAGGGGVQFGRGRVRPFAEARVLRVFDGGTPQIIPLAIGVRM